MDPDYVVKLMALARPGYSIQLHEASARREQQYYEALGKFVQMYAEVEQVAAQTLWKYAGTSLAVSKIVFAGTRTDQGSTWIKQLAEATSVPREAKEDLANVLQQLGIINGVRNAILHYGAEGIAQGRAMVSDAWKAKAEPTEFPVSPDDLTAMRDDLRKIIAHFGYRHLGRPWPKSPGGIVMLDTILQRPWRYKFPLPTKARTKEGKTLLAHRRRLIQLLRHRASRG